MNSKLKATSLWDSLATFASQPYRHEENIAKITTALDTAFSAGRLAGLEQAAEKLEDEAQRFGRYSDSFSEPSLVFRQDIQQMAEQIRALANKKGE